MDIQISVPHRYALLDDIRYLLNRIALLIVGTPLPDGGDPRELVSLDSVGNDWWATYDPNTRTLRISYRYARAELMPVMEALRITIIWRLGLND